MQPPTKSFESLFSPLDGKENFFPEMDERNERVGVGSFGFLTLLFPRVAPARGSGLGGTGRSPGCWSQEALVVPSTHSMDLAPTFCHPLPIPGLVFSYSCCHLGLALPNPCSLCWFLCMACVHSPVSYLFWSWFSGFCVWPNKCKVILFIACQVPFAVLAQPALVVASSRAVLAVVGGRRGFSGGCWAPHQPQPPVSPAPWLCCPGLRPPTI